ncbi:DgyrCDS6001 [Dimorphilus gyrociliatus]|uniref:Acyl-coenzyme A thioesterase 13 n=1 Tax=Dimorphilus gyrociliatus TaxID=2664684 RepID=A0A7I8VLN4_9ANNE|nr:DgyrCDS6001 [Dimorphilus gyrociliatus]
MRQIFHIVTKAKNFDRVIGKAKLIDGGNGRCICEMKVEEEHENRGQTLHGGMTATLVDNISTIALMSYNDGTPPGVSVNMNISYLKAAPSNTTIVIDARTLRVGKRLAYLSVDVTNKETSELIAQGQHTKFIGS